MRMLLEIFIIGVVLVGAMFLMKHVPVPVVMCEVYYTQFPIKE